MSNTLSQRVSKHLADTISPNWTIGTREEYLEQSHELLKELAAVPAEPPAPDGVTALKGRSISFVNEHGRQITIYAQPRNGLMRIRIEGPDSTAENFLTRMEYEKLAELLAPVISHSPAHDMRERCARVADERAKIFGSVGVVTGVCTSIASAIRALDAGE